MRRNTITFSLLLLTLFTLSACTSAQNETPPNVSQEKQETSTNTAKDQLTPKQAEDIALTHAGLTTENITRLHTEYEIDNGIPLYEVQFFKDQQEYDYTIHAETGEILAYDIDLD